MKKISMILVVALTLVVAFAANAMAAQTLKTPITSTDTAAGKIVSDYQATVTGDTAIGNAMNRIGAPGEKPNVDNRIHSHYTSNTNACAACHAVHTGVGAYLLQWSDGQATCKACHDGTTDTYDVYGGTIGKNVDGNGDTLMTWGGRFGVEESIPGTTHDVSIHDVDGGLKLNAAPGGNVATDAKSDAFGKLWSSDFDCMSCHDAHGKAGNFRILSPDVNDYSKVHFVAKANSKIQALPVGPGVVANTYVAVNATDNTFDWINVPGEYPYKTDAIYDGSTKLVYEKDYTFDNTSGFTKIVLKNSTSNTITADYHPGLIVRGTVSNYLTATESVKHERGLNDFCGACHVDYNTSRVNLSSKSNGSEMNIFYDQNATYKFQKASGAYGVLSGSYHAAYRHTVGFIDHAGTPNYGTAAKGIDFEYPTLYDGSGNARPTDVFTCLSCHVSHGADTTVWKGLEKKTVGTYKGEEIGSLGGFAGFEGSNENPAGSRLTRMPGFGTCLTCHDKVGGNVGVQY